ACGGGYTCAMKQCGILGCDFSVAVSLAGASVSFSQTGSPNWLWEFPYGDHTCPPCRADCSAAGWRGVLRCAEGQSPRQAADGRHCECGCTPDSCTQKCQSDAAAMGGTLLSASCTGTQCNCNIDVFGSSGGSPPGGIDIRDWQPGPGGGGGGWVGLCWYVWHEWWDGSRYHTSVEVHCPG